MSKSRSPSTQSGTCVITNKAFDFTNLEWVELETLLFGNSTFKFRQFHLLFVVQSFMLEFSKYHGKHLYM